MTTAVLEIRTYRLHPGTRDVFHRVMSEQGMRLLAEAGIDVVHCGPSEFDEDDEQEYVLIRAFESLSARQQAEDRFYGSRKWKDGPRADIVSRIKSMHTVVLTVPVEAVISLRSVPEPGGRSGIHGSA